MIDVGLLVIRVAIGVLVLGHGLQKLTGWFGGPGLAGWSHMLEEMGYRRPRALAWLHAAAESLGGLLLAVGLLTPLAVAAVVGVMLNAIVVAHGRNGLWVQDGGYEYPLALALVAAGVAVAGPGAWSVDAWAALPTSAGWGVAGIVAGLVVGLAVLVLGHRAPGAVRDGTTSPGSPSVA